MNNALGFLSREGSDFRAERIDGVWLLTMTIDRHSALVASGNSLIAAMTKLAASLNALQKRIAAADEFGLNLDDVQSVSSKEIPGDEKGMSADGVAGYFD